MSFLVTALIVWAQAAAPAQQVPVHAELTIQAGVLLPSGDLRMVARTPITLLNVDVAAKLMEVFRGGVSGARGKAEQYVVSKRLVEMTGHPDKLVEQIDEFVKTHAVASAVTDFDGKATLQAPPGDYFLYAYFEAGQWVALWNVPIQMKPGKNEIILDQNNTVR